MHPSYRSENVWFSKQSFDQFRAPQSYLLFEFLGVSLCVPPFSIMHPSYYGQKRFTLKILYRFVIKNSYGFDICLDIRFLSSIQQFRNQYT